MSKKRPYPRFLFSNPQNTLEKGPYIVHTQQPRFIVKATRETNDIDLDIVEVWDFAFTKDNPVVLNTLTAMKKWIIAQLINKEINF